MIRIFLESKDDKTIEADFMRNYLTHVSGSDSWKTRVEIMPLNGKDNLKNSVNLFRENTDAGGVNLVIFDADEPRNGGGFFSRLGELLMLQDDLAIEFDLFLFPNHQDDGDFETLLSNLINPKHAELLACFQDYEFCVGGKKDEAGNPVYEIPNRKSKMYAYIDSMKKTQAEEKAFKNKAHDYFFANTEYWDLGADYVYPLYIFLMNHLAYDEPE